MNRFIFYFVLLVQISLNAQKQEIEIEEVRGNSEIKLFAQNTTSDDLDLTFGIQVVGFTISEKLPVKKILKPGVKEYLLTLTAPKGVDCEYNTSVSYKKIKKVSALTENKGTQRTTGIQINPDKINVFTQDSCERCEYIISYLEKNKIPFLELNTSLHQPNQQLMFSKLAEAGFNGKDVQMPVIILKGKTDYNITNLSEYVKNMK